jgi:hypothetical protein
MCPENTVSFSFSNEGSVSFYRPAPISATLLQGQLSKISFSTLFPPCRCCQSFCQYRKVEDPKPIADVGESTACRGAFFKACLDRVASKGHCAEFKGCDLPNLKCALKDFEAIYLGNRDATKAAFGRSNPKTVFCSASE